jgi:thiosulfate reductase cytochrome b subunit
MWGTQYYPEISASINGLTYLAPFHTLIAWLFASFIVAHVYLTTTGPKPLAAINAMMVGWDEVEIHLGDEGDFVKPTPEESI